MVVCCRKKIYLRIINKLKWLLVLAGLSIPIYMVGASPLDVTSATVDPLEMMGVPEDLTHTEPTPEELVEEYSLKYGVDPNLAKAIIKCESNWMREVPNPYSSASGFFQFIDGTWTATMKRMGLSPDTDKHDPYISLEAGVWLLSQDGTRHWNASRNCWSKLI